ncbi:MAG: hypothetical protein RR712_01905 [Terrisporobacter sp.]|uniref:hypothetical protein n=1 Tax=Terrisporobacter sp. TaxID=1965305 RepID=UPI002FC93228
MLYTPKYIRNNDLDKKICNCTECKKYRILYCHTNMVENKQAEKREIESDVIATCSKCKRMYRFGLKYTSINKKDTYEVGKVNEIKENYNDVRENIEKNYNSFDSEYTVKSENFLTKVIKEEKDDNSVVSEYVFMEK